MHSSTRSAHHFTPGKGAPTRFAFFGDPVVPALHAAETEQAAVAESLVHDEPLTGGRFVPSVYSNKRISRMGTIRDLRLPSFMGLGLRRLGGRRGPGHHHRGHALRPHSHLGAGPAGGGFDGVVYMSRQCNSDRAYAFCGDRADESFFPDTSYRRDFGDPLHGLPRLITFCSTLGVDVLVR